MNSMLTMAGWLKPLSPMPLKDGRLSYKADFSIKKWNSKSKTNEYIWYSLFIPSHIISPNLLKYLQESAKSFYCMISGEPSEYIYTKLNGSPAISRNVIVATISLLSGNNKEFQNEDVPPSCNDSDTQDVPEIW